MATDRIVNIYPERKAVDGIYYDPCGNPSEIDRNSNLR